MKFIDVLEGRLHLDAVSLSFKVDRLVDRLLLLVQLPDKSKDAVRLVIGDLLRLSPPLVFIYNSKGWIEVGGLVHTALDLFPPESGLLKDGVIREEIHLSPCPFRFSNFGKKAVLQLHHRNSSLVAVMVDIAVPADLHIHIVREGVDYR